MSMNINVDMDFNPGIVAENLQNLHAIAKRGTEPVGIFAAENKIPIKVEMKRQSSDGSYIVTVYPCDAQYKSLARTIVFPKEKNKDKLRSEIINVIQSEINCVGKSVYNGMTLTERLDFLQTQAEQALESDDKENALNFLHRADTERDLLANRDSWVQLTQEERVGYHEQQANLFRKAGDDSRTVKTVNYHEKQAEFEGSPASKRAAYYQNLAKKDLKQHFSRNVVDHLELADQQWHSPEGKQEWEQLSSNERIKFFHRQADLYFRIGNRTARDQIDLRFKIEDMEKGKEFFRKARQEYDNAWQNLGPDGRVNFFQREAGLIFQIGDGRRTKESLQKAQEEYDSDIEAWQNLGPDGRVNFLLRQADLYVQFGDRDKAKESLDKARDEYDINTWKNLGPNGRANFFQNQADLYFQIGEKNTAKNLRDLAKVERSGIRVVR